MPFKKNTFFDTSRITVLFAFAAITIGMVALAGWIFDIEILRSFSTEWRSIKVNTAFGVICSGISLLLFLSGEKNRLAFLLALVVFLLGSISLSEYLFNWNANIDEILFRDKITPASMYPGRMGPMAAVGLIFLGNSLLLSSSKKLRRLSEIFGFIPLIIAFIAFAGYLYDVQRLYTIAVFSSLSLHTTLAFLLLSLAILFSKPEAGPMASFNENTRAARIGARQIIFLIVILFSLAWLCLKGYDAGYYDMQFGISIMVVAFVVIFFFAARVVILKLNATEKAREEMYKRLEESETNLKQVMDNSSGMIASIDIEHRVIVFNKALEYEYKRFCGKDLKPGDIHYKVFPPEGQVIWKSKIDEALSGNTVHFERTYEIGSQTKYAEVFLYPIRNGHNIEGVTCFVMDITKRKQAEEDLAIVALRNMALVQALAEIVYDWRPLDDIVIWDGDFTGILGYTSSEIGSTAESWSSRVHPEDIGQVLKEVEIATQQHRIFDLEYRFLKKDGTYCWMHDRAVPFVNDQGILIRMIGVFRDITERKKAEQAIKESEEKFRTLVQQADEGIFIVDLEGNYLEANESAACLTGYSIEELKKMNATEIADPDDLKNNPIRTEEIKAGKSVVIERVIRRKDKTLVKVEISAKLMDNGKVISILRDITERKKAEQKLQESEMKFKNLVGNIHESLIVEDVEGRLIYANNEFSRIFGFSEDEFKYLSIRDYTAPEFYEKIITRHNNRIKGIGVPREFEYKGLRKDGSEVWIECRVSVLTENGKIIGTQSLERDITKRKLAEEKLKESEERYRSLIEQAEDFILIVDGKGNILDVNSSLCNSLGYKKDELLGQFVSILVDPEDLKTTPIRLDRIKQGKSLITERRWIDRKGDIIEVEANSKMLFDGRIMAIVRDVRDRKKAEQALKESESKYRTIVETTDEMMHRLSQEGKILWVNESWKKNMGLTDREVIGKKITDFLDKTTKVEFGKVFPQLAKGKKTGNLSCGFITKKGEVIYLEGQVLPVIINGKFAGSQAFFRNVTERKKAEDKIREQENRYRALVDSAPDATVIVNEKGIIQMANLQAVKLLGYTKAELAGMAVEMLIPPSHQSKHKGYRLRYIKNPHTRSMGTGRDLVAVRKDGLEVPVEISLATYQFAGGNLITASLRDITERKKTEKELEKSYHSVRQLTEYLQNVREEERSHIAREIHDELGQQLTVMMMDVSWLSRKVGAENEIAKKKINELLNLLEGTVKTVRRISTELRPSVLDDLGLAAAMELHLREFEKRSGIQTCLVRSKKEPKLTGPVKNALFRIFQESLTNVARHSGAEKVIVKLESTNNKVILMIEDNGVGFDEKKASEKRTLGVLGMKERAAGIGGEYIISGKPGKGTTIFVTVPLPE